MTTLMEEANGSRFAANRLLRTETNYISNQATAEAYEDAGIEKYRYMSVLDGRTSKKCQEKDGQEFLLSEKEVGVNYPPLHPWCRSSVAPVIDGISHEHMKRWARDPVTGEEMKVPRDMSYQEWLKTMQDKHGVDTVEQSRKMLLNRSQDMKQYQDYISVMGKTNLPKTFDGFQQMKYTQPEKYAFAKLDYKRQSRLLSNPELALPNAANVTAADAKFTGYLFNPQNRDGWAKGVALTSRLGYDEGSWKALRNQIIANTTKYPVTIHKQNEYGTHYEQLMVLYGENGKPANVLVAWLNKNGKTRMTNAYIKEVKESGQD